MKLYSKEYTIPTSTIVRRESEQLMDDCNRLNLPAKAIYCSGDAAFEIWLNEDERQKIEVYATPFRTPIIPVDIFGFKIVGTATKKVTVHLLYEPQSISLRRTREGSDKKT